MAVTYEHRNAIITIDRTPDHFWLFRAASSKHGCRQGEAITESSARAQAEFAAAEMYRKRTKAPACANR